MSFGFSDDQELLRDTAREFLTEFVPAKAVRESIDAPEGNSRALWRRIAALGWLGLTIPEQYGGAGLGPIELAIVVEALGSALAPVPFLPNALAARAILEAGDEPQRRRWLPAIAAGDAMATLAIEPCNRSQPAGGGLTARGCEQGWLLSGRRLFVPDAATSDLLVLAAPIDGADEATLFVVPRGTPGLQMVRMNSMDPLRPLYTIELSDVELAHGHRLGAGDVAAPTRRILDHALVAVAAEMVGGAQKCLDDAVGHARSRVQFGKPIGSHQAIKHKCADMLLAVESARSITLYAAWAAGAGSDDAALTASMAKAYAGDAYRHVAGENIQIHGGVGFTWEYDCHLHFKRARSDDAWLGDARQHRERVAALLEI